MFDVLIIGGGVSGVSCALILGSALNKPYARGKKIGIFTHQKASALQDALFNNAYGIPQGKLGKEIMEESLEHLHSAYPDVEQIEKKKGYQSGGRNRKLYSYYKQKYLQHKNYSGCHRIG